MWKTMIKNSQLRFFGKVKEWVKVLLELITEIGELFASYSLELIAILFMALIIVMLIVAACTQQKGEKTDDPTITVRAFTYNGHRYFTYDRGVCHDEGGCPCRNRKAKADR